MRKSRNYDVSQVISLTASNWHYYCYCYLKLSNYIIADVTLVKSYKKKADNWNKNELAKLQE